MPNILFFGSAEEKDLDKIGVKGLNLAMLSKKGFKVPPGFIITKEVFDDILSRKEIKNAINDILRCPPEEIADKAYALQRLIKNIELPEEIADEIIEGYLSLSIDLEKVNAASLLETEEVYVAVRSSYLEEKGNISQLSQKTILNIKGKDRLFKAILECYAENFNPKSLQYKREHNLFGISMALIVQRMIESEKSGIAYSVNPDTGNNNEIMITACFGLGEGISSGNIFPDTYILDKSTLELKDIRVMDKQYEFVRDVDTDETVKQELEGKSHKQVLYDKDIIEISRLLKRIVSAFGKEEKIEWAIKKEIIYALQSKDIISSSGETHEKTESVEMEVYDNQEEKPDVIDIIEQPDIEEELTALEEIEKYENSKEEESKAIAQEEPDTEMNNQGIVFEEDKIEINNTETEEEVIKEKEDDSIFASYKGREEKKEEQPRNELPMKNSGQDASLERLSELAKMNAGNTIVYCHTYITEKLKLRLRRHTQNIPADIRELLDMLDKYEKVEKKEELIILTRVRNDFLSGLKYPEPEEIMLAMELIKEE